MELGNGQGMAGISRIVVHEGQGRVVLKISKQGISSRMILQKMHSVSSVTPATSGIGFRLYVKRRLGRRQARNGHPVG